MVHIIIKDIMDESYQDYKKPSMLIATCKCDWKCLTEAKCDLSICQNSPLMDQENIRISNDKLIQRYLDNPLTAAIVFGGLEPMLQFLELISFIKEFRKVSEHDIVIYTGYYEDEISDKIELLKEYDNITIKFGRFIPNDKSKFDEVLGVELASHNQYARKIS